LNRQPDSGDLQQPAVRASAMGSLRSWLGAVASFGMLLAAHRFCSGWAAPSFFVLASACAYIWTVVLRVPQLGKDLQGTEAVRTACSEEAASSAQNTTTDRLDGHDHEPKLVREETTEQVEDECTESVQKQQELGAALDPEAAQPSKENAENADGEVPSSCAAAGEAPEAVTESQQAKGQGDESEAEPENDLADAMGDDDKHSKGEALDEFADPVRAQELRLEGNEHFKAGRLHDAREAYSEALHLSPQSEGAGSEAAKSRAVIHCNRAACLQRLGRWDDVVSDCSQAIELDSEYVKAYSRRSGAYEELQKWSDSLEDLKKVLELEPSLRGKESRRLAMLEKRAQEQFEKDKDEMLSKLKDLGNTVLGKFCMSTDNFKMEQDPETGSYSLKFNN